MLSESLKENLDETIKSESIIKLKLYAVLNDTEDELNSIVTQILNKYDKVEHLGSIYTSVKELALNAAKANLKRLVFEEEGYQIDKQNTYEKGVAKFREKLNEHDIREYAEKAKDENLFVEVTFDYNENRLIVEVLNNSALTEIEDTRIHEKFKNGITYDSIADFYLDTQDNSEGAGMGITLILILMKAEGFDPTLFSIRSDYKTLTRSRIEFNFSNQKA